VVLSGASEVAHCNGFLLSAAIAVYVPEDCRFFSRFSQVKFL
jgi:hypothetical protein